ncbi:MAG: hypothetical protein A2128_03095 [Candidatus Liptonbacteria bacterium GWC1_60_9]|uniref:Antitoxin n=3 Tax=Candidatus Liptoniibacteriota TaxID=1817909 RepID=A0A1G2CLP7_9BACT|nr:MAG: hypothetical protein A2128_03095 [Candidatus Liptonbacteria bacterium GWC1_60_9]OGY98739.1 MAG: hypothetical protein A3E09_00410 [Candidatus Liptonbacteria bacterium RIFCSPHIGHO2_12_FULL_60_13]OGZ02279.1 MAG: hypothetical protein A3G64_03095 [Candidatus Liptonbacteria bacterium RIFCSPLOWO2_12_FULL_60_15]
MENGSTFDKIKEVLRTGSGKCIVLEGAEPRYVVMTWEEYRKVERQIEDLKRDWETVDINKIPL